jgi:hypothetical protein
VTQTDKQNLVAVSHAVGQRVGLNFAALNWSALWGILLPWVTSFPTGAIISWFLPALTSAPGTSPAQGTTPPTGGPTITPKP